jgi:hypothetical protein
MNTFQIMISGFISGELPNNEDPYKNDCVHSLMMDADLDAITLREADAILIQEALFDVKEEYDSSIGPDEIKGVVSKDIQLNDKFMLEYYPSIKSEKVRVKSDGSLSIIAEFTHTDDLEFYMDSDNGAELLSHGASLVKAFEMTNQNLKQIFLCDNGGKAKGVMESLQASDDSIFEENKIIAWSDNEGTLWPLKKETADKMIVFVYGVDADQQLYKVNNWKAEKIEPTPEQEKEISISY